jgi:hypothetical protein
MGVRSLGKAFLDLLTGPGDAGASKKDATDKDDSTPATSGSSAAVAYSRAGAVVERHGKPHLTAPQKAAGLGHPDVPQGIPEPVMHDPAETAPQPPSAAKGKGQPAHGTPVSAEREALIRRAIAIHRAKRGILDTLSDEQKERLAQMALAAFRVKH